MVDFCPDDTPELKAWRQEVRQFLKETLPNGMRFYWNYREDDAGWADYLAFWRKVAAKRWISLTWPKEYHGLGRSPIEKWILQEEFCAYDVPAFPVIGLAVASGLLRLGTHEQKLRFLKGLADCTDIWAEGYTEPGSGSDLASMTTRAHLDGDHWVINGQKTFGTSANRSNWMSVLARTDPNSKKHNGITCFLVKLDTPGISLVPQFNIADGRQNHTFFDNVRVPADQVLGDVGQAWPQIWFGQGGHEMDVARPSHDPLNTRIIHVINELVAYCRETKRGGVPLIEDPMIRAQLGEVMANIEFIKLADFEMYSAAASPLAQRGAAMTNIYQAHHKEYWPRMAQICLDIVGPMAQVQGGRWAQLQGKIEHFFRSSHSNHAGGTSQLKRMVLATRGLGLPR